MTGQNDNPRPSGLTTEQAKELQKKFGKNELTPGQKENIYHEILKALSEPMFLLLLAAAVIYFALGEPHDGAIMLVFVLGIISIDVIQKWKTDKTLMALKELSAPQIKVIRDGEEKTINSLDLVPGDIMLIAEGVKIPADGKIIRANDLCVDESTLTGEAEGVWKAAAGSAGRETGDYWRRDCCYAGTLVIQGSAAVMVEKTGAATEYGKIGTHIANAPENPTPLQKQTGALVKFSAGMAAVLFALVGCITWFNIPGHMFKDRLVESLLSGITLAMAMIPEEFPVILTVFLSMGAWRLAKKHSLVRKLPAVETLGAVSVLCVDKTGTITLNQMTVRETWALDGDEKRLSEIMGMACEIETYDPMEKAMLDHCENMNITREQLFAGELVTEYPFTNQAKMMGHVWKRGSSFIIAAKGSPERILNICELTPEERKRAEEKAVEMSQKGLRVIAVGQMNTGNANDVPPALSDCRLQLRGLIGLADPPRESVREDIKRCTGAGVRVVMITGDNGVTASSIARQVGMPNSDKIITGDELASIPDEELRARVREVNIFSRVVPEHKMRIVKAFKDIGEVVAMTGDGVNDAPALKYADIGIAMGKRGSEVSREAADLILLDDNFSTIVDTIKDGRRIYDNIKKAVGYVFSIHIPIACASLFAPLLGINPSGLMLLPVHIVLLELVIDPTCSIVLERQPAERSIMERPPRNPNEKILNAKSLTKFLLQGIAVFTASFGTYLAVLQANPQENAAVARTMGIAIILFCNILLVQVNSSHTDFAVQSMKRLAGDWVMWVVSVGTFAGLILMIYTPASRFLKLAPLTGRQFLLAIVIAFAAVMWFELVKLATRIKEKRKT
ncbi:cation-translocating P-type ATPase [Desulfotomaculum copahuensis]|uniref:HAD family hydrolase n=1 Tax=Desulfotomaculum copahuensis TaxID=1838280 RepID=A0A1B7LDM0_9FIRM|nr:cation-translocating P-type ATPase [Desulfotomaculum copahuensis]OAT81194.1 HAD family hydrolase [Desulfotomaculum copahuensis]